MIQPVVLEIIHYLYLLKMLQLIEKRFRDLQSLHQETLMEVDMLKMEAKRYTEQARISKENLEEILSEHADLENRLNRIKVCHSILVIVSKY